MEDERIWDFERSLWLGGETHYRDLVDEGCVMVLPQPPYVFSGSGAKERLSDTPRWQKVAFSDQTVSRPQDGLIVIGYTARAQHSDRGDYVAHCTSTLRRLAHEEWRVIQHQQTLTPTAR